MKFNGKEVLVCSCENTMAIDTKRISESLEGEGELALSNYLCRKQLDRFEQMASGKENLLVGCTQEIPLFLDSLTDLQI